MIDDLLVFAALVGPAIDAAMGDSIGPTPRSRPSPHLRAVVYRCNDRISESLDGSEVVDGAAFARRRYLPKPRPGVADSSST